MNYTPKELENICIKSEFFYGYKRGQVDDILEKISKDYAELKKENEELQTNVTIMKETVQHYKTIEEALQHTLIVAQHTSENITNNAYEKANNIIKEAEINAQKLINEANKKVDNLNLEYEELKVSLNAYKIKSQTLLSSVMEVLKNPFDELNDKNK